MAGSMEGTDTPLRRVTKELMAEILGLDAGEMTQGARLGDDFGADSLDRLELAGLMERRLGIRVRDRALADASTVEDVLRGVERAFGGEPQTALPVGWGAGPAASHEFRVPEIPLLLLSCDRCERLHASVDPLRTRQRCADCRRRARAARTRT